MSIEIDHIPDETASSTKEWEQQLGAQLRQLRIHASLDQKTLADRAGVSVGAVKNLESGKGSTLSSLIKVLRALGRTDWLAALEPLPSISPMQMLRSQSVALPQRVYKPRVMPKK